MGYNIIRWEQGKSVMPPQHSEAAELAEAGGEEYWRAYAMECEAALLEIGHHACGWLVPLEDAVESISSFINDRSGLIRTRKSPSYREVWAIKYFGEMHGCTLAMARMIANIARSKHHWSERKTECAVKEIMAVFSHQYDDILMERDSGPTVIR